MFHSLPVNRTKAVVVTLLFGLMLPGSVLFLRAHAASIDLPSDAHAMTHIADRQPSIAASAAVSVTSLWGGARESIVLKSDGTVWTFGINNCDPAGFSAGKCGKLGDGTQIARDIPVQVHGPGNVGFLTSLKAIMGGEHANYAIKADGTLWSWGANFVGQLGSGNYTNTVVPIQVTGLISVTMLGGRGYHNLAVTSDGKVWAWGWNSQGQLGHDTSGSPCPAPFTTTTCSNVPVQVIGITNPLTITGGGFFSLALMQDHTLEAWGSNSKGQLGIGSYVNQPSPVHVSAILSNVVQVSAGWFHAVALTADGKVWTWGDNSSGAIGNGLTSTIGVTIPFQVPGLSNVIAVSGGDNFTGILKSDGTVWTWGAMNDSVQYGQIGAGTFAGTTSPVQVTGGLTDVILYSARDYHNLAVKADGSLWAWGSGTYGELGNCQFAHSARPVRVLFPSPASPSIISPLVVTGSSGLPFAYSIDVSGTQPITLAAAGLPAWSSFNGSIISGTPNVTATSIVTITANNSFGCDMQLLQINIVDQHHNLYLPLAMK